MAHWHYLIFTFCLQFPLIWTTTEVDLTDFQGKADITFIIDDSGTIRENNDEGKDNWVVLKTFLTDMVSNLPMNFQTGAQIAIVKYSTKVETVFHLNEFTTPAELIAAIESLNYTGGNTNTADALKEVRTNVFMPENGDRPDARNIAVLITDGISNVNANETVPESRRVKESNIQLFTVGITSMVNMNELQEISSDPVWYHYFLSPDFSHLNVLQDTLVTRVVNRDRPVSARCDARADIVFIMDSSGSIRQKNPTDNSYDNWDLLKKFVSHVIDSLDVGNNATRVGVIKYSEYAINLFNLSTYSNKSQMLENVQGQDYMSGGTNTSGAIRLMHTTMFREENGHRGDVRKIAIVITDGESTIAENDTAHEAKSAKDKGIRMYSIGLTDMMDEGELVSIASEPVENHYLNSTDILHANTLVNRLVINLCDECALTPTGRNTEFIKFIPAEEELAQQENVTVGEETFESGCKRTEIASVCEEGQTLKWEQYENRMIVGNNYLRLQYIQSADECKMVCLQQSQCKSVDYSVQDQECSVSHIGKEDSPENFVEDPGTVYYEVVCEGGKIDIPETNENEIDNPEIPEDNKGPIEEIDIDELEQTVSQQETTKKVTTTTTTTKAPPAVKQKKTSSASCVTMGYFITLAAIMIHWLM